MDQQWKAEVRQIIIEKGIIEDSTPDLEDEEYWGGYWTLAYEEPESPPTPTEAVEFYEMDLEDESYGE